MPDDHGTIRVPKEAFEEAKARKNESNMTWAEYVTDDNRGTPTADDVATEITNRLTVDSNTPEDELEAIKSELKEIQSMLESAQESWEYLNGEEIHGTVHESDHELKDVINRIDDLEAQLPAKMKEQLR